MLFRGAAFGDGLQQELQRLGVGAPGAELVDPYIALSPLDQDGVLFEHFCRVLDGISAHLGEERREPPH